MTQLEITLDNSALSILYCKRRFQLTVIRGLEGISSEVINHGNAGHVMLELLDKGVDVDKAFEHITALYEGKANLVKVVAAVTVYRGNVEWHPPIEINGEPSVEYKFKYYYKTVILDDYEIFVYLAGTIDRMYIDPVQDVLVIRDYKFPVAATEYQVKKSMDEYDLNFQLPFYVFACLNDGTFPAVYRDYLLAGRYRTEIHFIFWNYSPTPIVKKRPFRPFREKFLKETVPMIIDQRIREAAETLLTVGEAAYDGVNVYGACKGCPFKPACMNMGTDKEEDYLSRFPTRIYDPLQFR